MNGGHEHGKLADLYTDVLTITLSGVAVGTTININNIIFTAGTTTSGTVFDASGSDAKAAAELTKRITQTNVPSVTSATSVGNTVTIETSVQTLPHTASNMSVSFQDFSRATYPGNFMAEIDGKYVGTVQPDGDQCAKIP